MLCSKFTPTAFLINMLIYHSVDKKNILSDAGAPVAAAVLNHDGPVCGILYGLISIKLAGDNVVFRSQLRKIHQLLCRGDDPRILPTFLTGRTWSTFMKTLLT